MNWVRDNADLIVERTLQHATIAVPAIVLCLVIAVPLGCGVRRLRGSRGVILAAVGLLYAIPSLPLFIALPALLGTGLRDPINVVVALTLYGIALMVRVTVDALDGIDHDVVMAATAVGFSPWARFWRVQLPLAGPVLVSGMRVVAVSTVSLTTVGAVLGVKSLGLLFTDGIQRNIPEEIISGIVMTMALAIAIDMCVVLAGRLLLPWATTTRRTTKAAGRRLRTEASSLAGAP